MARKHTCGKVAGLVKFGPGRCPAFEFMLGLPANEGALVMANGWQEIMGGYAYRFAGVIKDIVYPPVCLCCRRPVDGVGRICPDCWSDVHFLDGAVCDRCGLPFDYENPLATDCAACTASPPNFRHARAVFVYNEASKSLVLSLKHADRTDFVPTLAAWLARSGKELLAQGQVLVPVPLHWRRRVTRRFNQSAELARALSPLSGLPASLAALERVKSGPSQGALSRRGRMRNVAGAFRVREAAAEEISEKHVILIDDVLTTGATANACARALLGGGATQVDVLTLARVALPGQVAI